MYRMPLEKADTYIIRQKWECLFYRPNYDIYCNIDDVAGDFITT